jgi:hypothetical protein
MVTMTVPAPAKDVGSASTESRKPGPLTLTMLNNPVRTAVIKRLASFIDLFLIGTGKWLKLGDAYIEDVKTQAGNEQGNVSLVAALMFTVLGHIYMLAVLDHIMTQAGIRLPGDIDYSGTSFASIPAGLNALTAIPQAGLWQMILFVGILETGSVLVLIIVQKRYDHMALKGNQLDARRPSLRRVPWVAAHLCDQDATAKQHDGFK